MLHDWEQVIRAQYTQAAEVPPPHIHRKTSFLTPTARHMADFWANSRARS